METIKNVVQKIIEFIKTGNNKYIIISILSLITYIVLFYVLIGKNQEFHIYSVITNSIFLISVIGISLFILVRYDGTYRLKDRFSRSILYSIYVILGIIFLYFAISFLSGTAYVTEFVSYILQGLIIIGFLYLSYLLIRKTDFIKKAREYTIFDKLFNAIFLIPRYIYEGSSAVYNEIKDTPLYVFKIIAIQILFLTIWFITPYIMKLLYTHNGKQLLNKPVFTNRETMIADNDVLKKYNKNLQEQYVKYNSSTNKELPYRYGLSCWIYIDNQGSNMSSSSELLTPIFRYGNNPVISYNSSQNNLQITTQEGLDGTYVMYSTNNLPLQKWNNFIINYDGGKIDVFLNGELIATKDGIIPYVKMNNIVVGTEKGVRGGIANVMYFSEPLSQIKIDWLYKSFKNKGRPTI